MRRPSERAATLREWGQRRSLRPSHQAHAGDEPGDQVDCRGRDVRALALFQVAIQLLQIAGEGLIGAKGFRFHVRPPQAPTRGGLLHENEIRTSGIGKGLVLSSYLPETP